MSSGYVPQLGEPGRRWVRFGALLLALAVLGWLAAALRPVLTPVLAAAALAYILNPLVTRLERYRIERLHTVIVVFVLVGIVLLAGGVYVAAKVVGELIELARNLPEYVAAVGEWLSTQRSRLGLDLPPATATAPAGTAPATQSAAPPPAGLPRASWWTWAGPLAREHGVAVVNALADAVRSATTSLINLVSLLVLVPLFTFYFLWRFNDLVRVVRDHLPAASRAAIVHTAATIDAAMANFFRGRLIVCLIVGAVNGLGWSLVGVPYSVLLGLLAGTLNLVPYVSVLALPPALFFAYMGAVQAGQPWFWPLVLTVGVYLVAQALESFVLSPYIEGRSSGLHPLVVVLALLIGGQLAGLLGMLLAVPVASTLRTLAAQWLLPEIRRLAEERGPSHE